jgi:hypothetical protein
VVDFVAAGQLQKYADSPTPQLKQGRVLNHFYIAGLKLLADNIGVTIKHNYKTVAYACFNRSRVPLPFSSEYQPLS